MDNNEGWGVRLPYKVEQLADLLDQTRWANECTWDETLKLCEHMLAYEIPKGRCIFKEGDSDHYMGFILKGKVNVNKVDAKHQLACIATVRAPQSLGEMCLIDGQPRSASAEAATDVLMLILTRESYLKLSGSSPQIANKLLVKIAQMLSQRLRATSGQLVDFLGDVPG